MIKAIRFSLPFVALAVTAAAFAQPGQQASIPPATSLDDLYKRVEQFRAAERAEFERHKSEYDAAGARQQQMLTDATRNRDQLEQRSEELTKQHSDNDVRINALNAQLRDKAASFGLAEIFGLARQVANDASPILQQSMITVQFPPAAGQPWRDEFLRSFADSDSIPTTADLERVWLEIQREMTASGQVAKFQTTVVQPGGEEVQSEVIRIGPFTALSDGKFLAYLPALRTLNVLPRQLPAEFMEVAERFKNATSGYAQAVVDSNRGVLLGLYVERPTFMERIELGEWVGYVIIAVGVLGILAFLFQLVYLIIVRMGVSSQLKNLDKPNANNPLGRVLLAFKGDKSRIEEDADIAELRITEAVLHEVPKLERFQAFLRLAVAAGPLLGLIGTVIGMILTFQSITESGSSDPKLMANGIGQAMIATVLGLGIAIPLLFANALLNSLSRTVVQILDEQSAGMLAESIEKQRRA